MSNVFVVFAGIFIFKGCLRFSLQWIAPEYNKPCRKDEEIASLGFALIVIVMPILEEVIFRGIPLWITQELFSVSHIVSAIIFMLIHAPNYERGYRWIAPYFFIVGMIFSFIAIEYGLMYAMLYHMMNNFIAWMINNW